ncbi:gliding motility-associated ABC transporter ATP-binding subunit GldA [uncultured Polaribacter sp.]|uniref:gliding motility-associated ABC transporter ATP-binding subunit GldA n=1 Tax=uncultured Polaribacter sp. TaxID=174711 RepID=UPI000A9E401B|nr:gliding motility-associated ABC transporter ATP-binding subunit GldA [Polaribacter sp.]|tara:strand:- start:140 stop:1033 length:894 start_codon:yes stop_codon:yes gene_type:complete
MSINVISVSKKYTTEKVLDTVSFSAEKGQIIGFLGPNGAGKSTMMRILTGYLKPDSGAIFVDEIDVLKNAIQAQRVIGYLPEHNPLYEEMYVREYLQFQAAIFKVEKSQIENCIAEVGLTKEAHKKINQLSKGYQQRVGLAAAILHKPTVLILDEPTTGLDPNQLVAIRALIKALGKDKTILLSTHIMQEVEAVCDRVIIIKKGAIVLDEKLKELQRNTAQVIDVIFNIQIAVNSFSVFADLNSVINTSGNTWQLTFDHSEDMRSKVFDFAQENGLKILSLNTQSKNLETLFREITQ